MAFPWPSAGVGPAGGGTFAMWAPESQGGGAVSTVDGGTDDGGAGEAATMWKIGPFARIVSRPAR